MSGATTPVVIVTGEVDGTNAPAIEEDVRRLVDAGATEVVVDLRDVTFMGSGGLAALLEADKLTRLVLRDPSQAVRDLLEMTHLTDHFRVG